MITMSKTAVGAYLARDDLHLVSADEKALAVRLNADAEAVAPTQVAQVELSGCAIVVAGVLVRAVPADDANSAQKLATTDPHPLPDAGALGG
jgi:hypothetical protein